MSELHEDDNADQFQSSSKDRGLEDEPFDSTKVFTERGLIHSCDQESYSVLSISGRGQQQTGGTLKEILMPLNIRLFTVWRDYSLVPTVLGQIPTTAKNVEE